MRAQESELRKGVEALRGDWERQSAVERERRLQEEEAAATQQRKEEEAAETERRRKEEEAAQPAVFVNPNQMPPRPNVAPGAVGKIPGTYLRRTYSVCP